jgi:autophagy-related protein 2
VFEAVIPSEKTSIVLKLQECSLRTYAPTHSGALLLHVGDLEFTTDIIGSAVENAFHILIPNLSLLTVDDVTCCEDVGVAQHIAGVSYWKVIRISFLLLYLYNNTPVLWLCTCC